MTRRRAEPAPPHQPATCRCGNAVVSVQLDGAPVLADVGGDPDGEIGGVRVNGRWSFAITADDDPAPVVRYRRHRCVATMQADLARSRTDTAGPCGGCGRTVPHRYGPRADTLCKTCKARRVTQNGPS